MTLPRQRCTGTCSGKRRPAIAGKPCRNWAIDGSTVCRMHGAGSPKVAAKAAERVEEARLRRVLDGYTPSPVGNPVKALADIAGRITGWLDVVEARVAELDRLDTWSEGTGEQTKAVITIFERAMDAARRVLTDMVRLDLEKRMVTINEEIGEAVAGLLKAVMDDPRLALTAEQRAKVPKLFRRHLAITRGEPEPEPDEAS